jgi:hypothetical protein
MRASYGGVQLGDFNWARVRWGTELRRNAAGMGYGQRFTADFAELGFVVAGQFSADAAAAIISAALAVEEGDLVLANDDGSPSFKSVANALTFSGVRCVRGPVWSDAPGAQHATHLRYAATFEWLTTFGAGTPILLDYSETVTVEGGNPLIKVQEYLNASPVAYQTIQQQKYVVTQQGYAVGSLRLPSANPPLAGFPAPNQNSVSVTTPQRVGRNNYEGHRVDWGYQWELARIPAPTLPAAWTE